MSKILMLKNQGKEKEYNPFGVCEVCDPLMDDVEEVKMMLVSVKTIYLLLDPEERQKPIYLNLAIPDMFIHVLHEKECLMLPEPINELLEFWSVEELEECALHLMEEYRHYQVEMGQVI